MSKFMKAFGVLLFLAAALALRATEPSADYSTWIRSWTNRPANDLQAVVSIITGEKELAEAAKLTPVQRLDLAYHIKVSATEIGTNGACRSYFVSNTDPKAGEVRQISEEKISAALAQLPDDQGQLPPAGKRVVVQVWENGAWHIRVYDGNQLPSQVKSLLDLLANPYDQLL
jgi:hypothetical protein